MLYLNIYLKKILLLFFVNVIKETKELIIWCFMSDIVKNFKSVQSEIDQTFTDFFIKKHDINIIAVSKFHPAEKIISLLEAGHRIFGENRLQEAQEKWPALKEQYPDIRLHMIGSLQSNKIKQACALFDVLENIDSKKHIDGLVKYRNEHNALPELFIQVNTGREEQKSGILPENLESLLEYAHSHNIDIQGLMSIPPAEELPVYHFTMLKNLANTYNIPKTSMGMSADYKQAIICKTDYIRIGTAIFGARGTA